VFELPNRPSKNLDILDCWYFYQLQYVPFWFYGPLLIGAICGVIKLGPGLVDQVSIMGSLRDSRNQALAQLKLQLADTGRLLHEIEKRSL
jgi:hypothetical protein